MSDAEHRPDTPPAEGEANARRLSGRPLLGVALAVVLLFQALFVLSYVGALHDPKPRSVPFGIVGPASATAALTKQLPLDVTSYASEAALRTAIDEREVYGGLVVGAEGARLIVAPAASRVAASALTAGFTQVAAATGQKLTVVEVHRLPKQDPVGSVSFLVVMALVVGGYLSSTIAMQVGGTTTQRGRGLALAGAAVIGGLLTVVLAGPILGGIPPGHFWELWAIFSFVMLAVALATAALQTLLGAAGTLVVVVVFVIVGAPAAGGSAPGAFLPGFWRTIGPYLPPGAGTSAVRNTIYFDGNAVAGPLIVLGAYLVGGAAVLLLFRRKRSGQRDVGAADALEATGAAAPIV